MDVFIFTSPGFNLPPPAGGFQVIPDAFVFAREAAQGGEDAEGRGVASDRNRMSCLALITTDE